MQSVDQNHLIDVHKYFNRKVKYIKKKPENSQKAFYREVLCLCA